MAPDRNGRQSGAIVEQRGVWAPSDGGSIGNWCFRLGLWQGKRCQGFPTVMRRCGSLRCTTKQPRDFSLDMHATLPNTGCWAADAGRAGITSRTSNISVLWYTRRRIRPVDLPEAQVSAQIVVLLSIRLLTSDYLQARLSHTAGEGYGLLVPIALGDTRSTTTAQCPSK